MTDTTNALLLQLEEAGKKTKMVSQKHAAMLLGYSLTHLCRLNLYPMKDNHLPRVVMGNGRVFYLVEDLKRFLERRSLSHGR